MIVRYSDERAFHPLADRPGDYIREWSSSHKCCKNGQDKSLL